MSSQKGNTKRSRPQKYQNQFAFKNNLHDTSHKTKTINSLQIANVCERCKKIIEWKIKYKKYKPLKAPGKCNKCEQKTVKHAYHTMCGPCAKERNVCPKCECSKELVPAQPTREEQIQLDAEMQQMLKTLPERKRRTFLRYMNKQNETKEKKKKRKAAKEKNGDYKKEDGSDNSENSESGEEESVECSRDQLIDKLKSLMVDGEKDEFDDDDFGSDFDDGDDDDDCESDVSE